MSRKWPHHITVTSHSLTKPAPFHRNAASVSPNHCEKSGRVTATRRFIHFRVYPAEIERLKGPLESSAGVAPAIILHVASSAGTCDIHCIERLLALCALVWSGISGKDGVGKAASSNRSMAKFLDPTPGDTSLWVLCLTVRFLRWTCTAATASIGYYTRNVSLITLNGTTTFLRCLLPKKEKVPEGLNDMQSLIPIGVSVPFLSPFPRSRHRHHNTKAKQPPDLFVCK